MRLRITCIASLLVCIGANAAEQHNPNSFLDSLQLMDGSQDVVEEESAVVELSPTEVLQNEGGGEAATLASKSEEQGGSDEGSPDLEEGDTDRDSGSKEIGEEPNLESQQTVQFPGLRVRTSDIAAANEVAKPVKQKYLQGKGGSSGAKPAQVVPQESASSGLRKQLTVTPGVLEVLTISSAGHINRIVTPFDEPLVKTTSSAEINTVGSVIEVSTQSPGTIVIYVSDQEQTPETTFGLALVPKAVPPLDISLRFDALLQQQVARQGKMSAKAKKWEEQQDYVDALISVMKPLANQQIPPGYSFSVVESEQGDKDLFRCRINGLSIQLQQRLDGHHFKVGVHKVKNLLSVPIEIRETACYRKGIAGISAYPQVVLRPGETTELYIVQKSSVDAQRYGTPARPSVVSREVPHGSF